MQLPMPGFLSRFDKCHRSVRSHQVLVRPSASRGVWRSHDFQGSVLFYRLGGVSPPPPNRPCRPPTAPNIDAYPIPPPPKAESLILFIYLCANAVVADVAKRFSGIARGCWSALVFFMLPRTFILSFSFVASLGRIPFNCFDSVVSGLC